MNESERTAAIERAEAWLPFGGEYPINEEQMALDVLALAADLEAAEKDLWIEREHNPHRVFCPKCSANLPCESCARYSVNRDELEAERDAALASLAEAEKEREAVEKYARERREFNEAMLVRAELAETAFAKMQVRAEAAESALAEAERLLDVRNVRSELNAWARRAEAAESALAQAQEALGWFDFIEDVEANGSPEAITTVSISRENGGWFRAKAAYARALSAGLPEQEPNG